MAKRLCYNGINGHGVVIEQKKIPEIIKWVNKAIIIGKADLPPEMAAPSSRITIFLTDNRSSQIFMYDGKLIIDFSIAIQNDLKGFLINNSR